MKHKLILFFVCFSSLITLTSCDDSEFEYSNYQAYFVFDNSQRLDATLSSAMNPLSPGIFCKIAIEGSNYISFVNNQGLNSKQMMTAVDQRRTCILGIYNGSGVIVGYGALSDPPAFYAYDVQCPNCYEQTNKPNSPLSMDTNGKAICKKCQRTYDMNNGGIIIGGEGGKKMIRYHASTTGPNGVLKINN